MHNQITIIGSLGRDPESRALKNGGGIVTLSVATNHSRKVGDNYEKQTVWHRVKVFGKSGDACMRFLKKGAKVCVNGRQENGSYEKDGQRVHTSEIIAAHGSGGVIFLSSRPESGESGTDNPFQDQSHSAPGNFGSDDSIPFPREYT